jgi:DNA (cytosine-5)-methyltransferase 1
VISLFTGAGGLDLGLEQAGFHVALCVESDDAPRRTLSKNRGWSLSDPGDIHSLRRRGAGALLEQAGVRRGQVALLSGGPPCQPWSKSAQWRKHGANGWSDPRSKTLRAFMHVVAEVRPEVFLLENVNGMKTKTDDFAFIQKRLRQINNERGNHYNLQVVHINAADYGVPQRRERVFLLAHRGGRQLKLPAPTHGPETDEPYRTAWDAIGHLDIRNWPSELAPSGKWARLLPSIPEGENYLWHTKRGGGKALFGWRRKYWSFLLKLSKKLPSWTLQAAPGPATGPFHWRNRHLSIAELCALQTFPNGYEVAGSLHTARRQIGNAVPCAIGELLGLEIRRQLLGEKTVRRKLQLIPEPRTDRPRAHPTRPVPREFLDLVGDHEDHPGHGLGPGRQ